MQLTRKFFVFGVFLINLIVAFQCHAVIIVPLHELPILETDPMTGEVLNNGFVVNVPENFSDVIVFSPKITFVIQGDTRYLFNLSPDDPTDTAAGLMRFVNVDPTDLTTPVGPEDLGVAAIVFAAAQDQKSIDMLGLPEVIPPLDFDLEIGLDWGESFIGSGPVVGFGEEPIPANEIFLASCQVRVCDPATAAAICDESATTDTIFQIHLYSDRELPETLGDFNQDGNWDCVDINALTSAIAANSTDLTFDMNGDGLVSQADLTDVDSGWLTVGGENNPIETGGAPFLPGDADLSGAVDVSDFNIWNSNKFDQTNAWCAGDFNADGATDVSDFNIWNANKFTTSGNVVTVPEPSLAALIGIVFLIWGTRPARGLAISFQHSNLSGPKQ